VRSAYFSDKSSNYFTQWRRALGQQYKCCNEASHPATVATEKTDNMTIVLKGTIVCYSLPREPSRDLPVDIICRADWAGRNRRRYWWTHCGLHGDDSMTAHCGATGTPRVRHGFLITGDGDNEGDRFFLRSILRR